MPCSQKNQNVKQDPYCNKFNTDFNSGPCKKKKNLKKKKYKKKKRSYCKYSSAHTFKSDIQSEFPLLNEKTKSIIKHLKKAGNMEMIDNSKQANKKIQFILEEKGIIFKKKNIIINTTGKKRDDHLSLVQDQYRNKEQNIQRRKKTALQFKNITVGFKILTDQGDKIEQISRKEKQNINELEEGKRTSKKVQGVLENREVIWKISTEVTTTSCKTECLAQWMEIDLYTVSFLNAVGKKGFTSYGERGGKKTLIYRRSRIRMNLTVA